MRHYRADIDGLRAVAVMSVVLYHSRLAWPSGGFIGVDIFFVISGYLIAGLLQADLDAGRFSLARFYERRARRLLPALVAMVLACCIAGWFLMLPGDFRDFGRSVVAVMLFASNFLFFWQIDYFFVEGLVPLLHTWSLAVEEQFYILAPLFLFAVHRYARRWLVHATALLAVLSFAASVYMVNENQQEAFYMLQSRAFELLAGALVAFGALPRRLGPLADEATAWCGAGLILAGLFWLDSDSPFPGAYALLPTLGTALLVHAGTVGQTLPTRLLAQPAMVFIGLISYSLYLWHWPINVFFEAWRGRAPTTLMSVGLVLLSVGVAWLSWRFIERPFRNGTITIARRQPAIASLAGLAVLGAAGGAIIMTNGVQGRFSPEVVALESFAYRETEAMRAASGGRCFVDVKRRFGADFWREHCLATSSDRPNYLLLGDSHAAHFATALREQMPADTNFLVTAVAGCKPTLVYAGEDMCKASMGTVFHELLPRKQIDTLILSARWRSHHLKGLPETIAFAQRYVRRVVVLGPIVEYRQNLPQVLAWALHMKDDGFVEEMRMPDRAALDRRARDIAEGAGATYVSAFDAICPEDKCRSMATPETPMQYDYGHLTLDGARIVVRRFMEAGLSL